MNSHLSQRSGVREFSMPPYAYQLERGINVRPKLEVRLRSLPLAGPDLACFAIVNI